MSDTAIRRRSESADALREAVRAAIATVPDPEYPDISIVDLGLLETIEVDGDIVHVALIPTFGGCPALRMIAADVRAAVEAVHRIERCEVEWLADPAWTTDRLSAVAERALASDYTVVLRGRDGRLRCPVCGSDDIEDRAMAGPTRCRSVAWCNGCRNAVEVMRS